MTPTALQVVDVGSAVLAILLDVVGLAVLLRSRRRHRNAVQDRTVSRTLRRGGRVPVADRPVAVHVVEQLLGMVFVGAGTLVLSVSRVVLDLADTGTIGAVHVVLLGAAGLSEACVLALCARLLRAGRRQGIRPERLW